MPTTVQVAVADTTLSYDKLYTYEWVVDTLGTAEAGRTVLVPFGRGKAKPRIGVVAQVCHNDPPNARTKQVIAAAPPETQMTAEHLGIVRYLKQATFCTWYEAVKAVIPYGAQYKPVHTADGWTLREQMMRHVQTVYTLAGQGQKPPTAKQQQVLDFLQQGPVVRQDILDGCGVGRTVLDTMVKNGLLSTGQEDKILPEETDYAQTHTKITLSPTQEKVATQLKTEMAKESPRPALLHGVTGSGKTPVFLELIRFCLNSGKTALVLVPEIGLTPQMIATLRQAFGTGVAVQHSRLSHTERLLQWRQIQRGEMPVVVGTRSAVFAPLQNIGLLVVDEEQEHTYQSESAPRYNAIEVARRRAAHHKALLVLASATPAVVDYYAALQGKYTLLQLPERYAGQPLPTVEMVDMREEIQSGNTGGISRRLAQEIGSNIEAGQQTILLLNRRGYHTVGMCRQCRTALGCSECSVPMVYHKAGNRLLCHYCGRAESPPPMVCPECGGEIIYTGFGTQRMEDELAELFPKARVMRMDMDTTSRKGSHAALLSQFGRGEYDILLGTQMVAKGLDFERVSLVGIVGIDSLLFGQGYRAFETVFSLVTQVVGRSGRAKMPGRALVQTQDPENPVLQLAAKQDYEAFYQQEIAFRKMGLYPPFCALCTVGFVAKTEAAALAAAKCFCQAVQTNASKMPSLPLRVLGPAPMHVVQVAGSYRYRLTLKCRPDGEFRELMEKTLAEYRAQPSSREVTAYIDFNSDASA